MKREDQLELIQDIVTLVGTSYIVLLSSLDGLFGAPLSTNEKVVLQMLDEEPVSIKDVSLRTGLALSTLTNVFDKMEEKRLVKRRHSRRDRRVVKIELDVAGRRLRKKFNRLIRQIAFGLAEALPEGDRQDLPSVLEKVGRFLSRCTTGSLDGPGAFLGYLQAALAGRFGRR
jgi:DNA-binding MarR family transcriptional regulator